jgi:hypothetical protein
MFSGANCGLAVDGVAEWVVGATVLNLEVVIDLGDLET